MRFLVFFVFLTSFTFGQFISKDGFALTLGAHLEIGFPVNKIGLSLNTSYVYGFAAVHAGSTCTYHLSDLGLRKNFSQLRIHSGIQLFGGKKKQNFYLPIQNYSRLSNQNMGIGYQYLWYLDNIKTTQKSGAWTLFIEKTTIYFENDIFAGQGRDRFRTGQILVDYREKDIHFYSGITLWTGESRGGEIYSDSAKNIVYRDLRTTNYGKTSHGIFFGGIGKSFTPIHNVNAFLGIDSEKIRNIFQNKLFHSHSFVKTEIFNTTPTYPMLNKDGVFTFDKKLIRRNRIYFQASLNQTN